MSTLDNGTSNSPIANDKGFDLLVIILSTILVIGIIGIVAIVAWKNKQIRQCFGNKDGK